MKKTLITEINRIQELMGKPLITEIKIPVGVIDDLGTYLLKTFKNIDVKLKDLIDDLKSTKISGTEKLNILTKLSKENEKMSEIIIPRIMNSLPEEVKELISKFKVDIKDKIARAKINNYSEIDINVELDKGINNLFDNMEGLTDDIKFIMRKDLTDYANKVFKDSPAPVVKPKIPTLQTTTTGQIIRFKDVLLSYLTKIKNINKKINDDIEQYKYFRNIGNNTTDITKKQEAMKNANRFLDRVDLNLGILNRTETGKEEVRTFLDVLGAEMIENTNPRGVLNAEGKLQKEIINKLKNKEESVSILEYLPKSSATEADLMTIGELRTKRINELKKIFFLQKNPKVKELGYFRSLGNILIGNWGSFIKRIANNPKELLKVLSTETGARVFNYMAAYSAFKTLYDMFMERYVEDVYMDKEFYKEHPWIANAIRATSPSFREFEGGTLGGNLLKNFIINSIENIGVAALPAKLILDWFMTDYESDGTKWFLEKQKEIEEIQNSSLSNEEKNEKIKKMLTKPDSFVEKIWYMFEQPSETLERTIAKELAALEKPTVFTNDEKGFKDWCEAKQKPFKSYNGGLGKTTDGQVWEFKNGTFQLFI
jgi:hypothetical protein